MKISYTTVLLACVLGASLGGPIGKREATATPCVDHSLDYTHNSTLLESIRRICSAAKDLENHINITETTECQDVATLPIREPDDFDIVLQEVQMNFPKRISAVILHGQNINTSSCNTLEDERLRLDITTKLAVLRNAVQEMVVAGCRASIRGLRCDGIVTEYTGPVNPDQQVQLRVFKCEAKNNVAHSIRSLIGRCDDNDWWFTATTGPLGCV